MILVIDMCFKRESLSRHEFVDPIVHALEAFGASCEIMHFLDISNEKIMSYDGIVLCGNALMDNDFKYHEDRFSWIFGCKIPILGICAGMQTISKSYGGYLIKKSEIGLCRIDIVKDTSLFGKTRSIEGYHLHSYTPSVPNGFEKIACSANGTDAFKHNALPTYGIIFHPEVRNTWILENFLNIIEKKEESNL